MSLRLFSLLAGGDSFYYGNLDSIYNGESYAFIKEKRLHNWSLLKQKLDKDAVVSITNRLECFVAVGDQYNITKDISLIGVNKDQSKVVCYPIFKGTSDNYVFTFGYQYSVTLNNVTVGAPTKGNKFESYQPILKYGADSKVIKLTGSIRDGFWDDLTIGDTIAYSWTDSVVLGKTNTVASFDSNAETITLTSDIDAAVSNDMSGSDVWFCRPFNEEISVSDYETYGQGWVWEIGKTYGFYGAPAANSGTPFNFNLVNSRVENFHSNVYASMGNGYFNISGQSEMRNAGSSGLSFFGRNNNGEKIIKINTSDRLTIENSGTVPVGSITVLTGTLGAGIYAHPNVQIRGDVIGEVGDLYLTNNPAASCRQYSSSGGSHPVPDGAYTELGNVICEGSGEYDMLLSNQMPTTINYLESSSYIIPHYDLTVKGGTVKDLQMGIVSMAARNHVILFQNCSIEGHWNGVNPPVSTVSFYYEDCTLVPELNIQSGGVVTLMFAPSADIDRLEFTNLFIDKGNNYEYTLGESLNPTTYKRGVAIGAIRKIGTTVFNGVTSDQYYGEFLIMIDSDLSASSRSKVLTIIDSDILLWTPSLNNNVVETNIGRSNYFDTLRTKIITADQGLGYNRPQKFGIKSGQITKAIVANPTYSIAPQTLSAPPDISPTNVLEIDWDHDEYFINGPATINHIAPILWYQNWKGSCSNMMKATITISAIGGDVTVNARDESTNPYGNINDTVVITAETSRQFTVDSNDVLSNSSDTTPTIVVGVTTTSTTINGYIPEGIIRPAISTITIGSVVGTSDLDGNITGTGITEGFVDYGTGHFYLVLSSAPTNGTDIEINYTKINDWRASGSWSLI